MSGEAGGVGASMLRGVLACAEPLYAGLMRVRDALYDAGWFAAHRLGRPVISVGNITAGGTGKTPVVAWLVQRLREAGHKPAVLMRGYKSAAGISDEQALLAEALGVIVHAQADRVAGGEFVVARHPEVDVLVLDDGFQHRRLARDFDLVLLDATRPFGYGHVHPRGLLREPLVGLKRADGFIITRCDQATAVARENIERTVRQFNPRAPIFAARHAHTGFRSASASAGDLPDISLSALDGRRFFVVAGIGNPQSLERQMRELPGTYVGHWFAGDHHAYGAADVGYIRQQAMAVGADTLVVTEKDWVKLRHQNLEDSALPIWRIALEIEFEPDHAEQLLRLLEPVIAQNNAESVHPSAASPGHCAGATSPSPAESTAPVQSRPG